MGQKEGVEGEEPGEEPDARNGNVVRMYPTAFRRPLHQALSAASHLVPVFFIGELSEMRRPRAFRHGHSCKPADNQHKSRRGL